MKQRYYVIGLIFLTALIFFRVTHQDFVAWDDDIQIYSNPDISPLGVESLKKIWFHPILNLYVPLTYTVWMIIAQFAHVSGHRPGVTVQVPNYDPGVFHTANLILHLINVTLVYFICLKLSRKTLPSLIGASVFALHPLQVEPVVWISELRGLLAGMFMFAAILLHLEATNERELGRTRWGNYEGFGVFAGLLALLAKPSAVVLPLILWFIDVGLRNVKWREAARSLVAYAIFPVFVCVLTKIIQPVASSIVSPLWLRPFIVMDSLYFYALKLVCPIGYAIDYGRTTHYVQDHILQVCIEAVVPIAMLVAAYLARSRFPFVLICLAILWINILPVSGIVPFIFQGYSTVADRYMYGAMLGVALILAFGLPEKFTVSQSVICGLIVVTLSCATITRIPIWDNTTTLMWASLAVNPNSWVEHNNLGVAYSESGNQTAALGEFQKAASCDPTQSSPRENIQQIYQSQAKYQSDYDQFSKALSDDPHNFNAAVGLGDSLVALQEWDQAIEAYRKAIRIHPADSTLYYSVATIEGHLRHYQDAEEDFRKAVTLNDHDPKSHFQLAQVLLINHKLSEARVEYQKAVELGYQDQAGLAQLGQALGVHQ